MNSDFERTLRRLKPDKKRDRLKPRDLAELPMIGQRSDRPGSLLYDTTVYIDILQGKFPTAGESLLLAADAWHSTVTEAELAATCGLLEPGHPGTQGVIKEITRLLDRRPAHRTIAPDREIWRDAGILTGVLARLQGLEKSEQRRIFNDALIFSTARRFGHTVLTRNIVDFDFLNQLDPSGRVLFYQQ